MQRAQPRTEKWRKAGPKGPHPVRLRFRDSDGECLAWTTSALHSNVVPSSLTGARCSESHCVPKSDLVLPDSRASIPANVPAPLCSAPTLPDCPFKTPENYSSHSASRRDTDSGDLGQVTSGQPSYIVKPARGRECSRKYILSAVWWDPGTSEDRSQVRASMAPTASIHSPSGPPEAQRLVQQVVNPALNLARVPSPCHPSLLGLATPDIPQVPGPGW